MSKDAPRTRAPAKGGRLLWFIAFYALSLVIFTALVYLLRTIVKG